MGHRRRRRGVADAVPAHHHPVPVARSRPGPRTGPAVYLCFSLAQGLTRPLTPMGLAGFRLIASSVARAAEFDVPDAARRAGRRTPRRASACSSTSHPVLRSTVGRAIVPRVFDIMEARSAAVLRRLFADPASPSPQDPLAGCCATSCPVAAQARVPETLLRGTVPARGRAPAPGTVRPERFRAALELVPAGVHSGERLDHAERHPRAGALPDGTRHPAAARPGIRPAGGGGKAARAPTPARGTCSRCCADCPTT